MVLVPRPRLQIDNIADNEVVHQRCLLLKGATCGGPSGTDGGSSAETFLIVKSRDAFTGSASQEKWPVMNDAFRCLVMLQPGPNELELELYHGAELYGSATFTVQYQPLLQLPPLHLAVIVAKDSPYATSEEGADPGACNNLDTAIVKFRTTAYMWQAYIAETMRSGGMGRRSFRLDEPWTANAATARMDAVAQVHVVRSERTIAELQRIDYSPSQRSSSGRDELMWPFEQELVAYGAPFVDAARPVVAAMLLDTDWHYAADQEGTLADVQLYWCKPNRPEMSFFLFSSQLACAWPRSLEEASACLLDTRPMETWVSNTSYRDLTMEEACSKGQTTALSSLTRTWGCVNDLHIWDEDNWKHTFVPTVEPRDTQWRLPDGLRLRMRDHFKLPGDFPKKNNEGGKDTDEVSDLDEDSDMDPEDWVDDDEQWDMTTCCLIDENDHKVLSISYRAGLAQVCLIRAGNTVWEHNYYQATPPSVVRIDQDDVADGLADPRRSSRLRMTGMDGHWGEQDVQDLFASTRAPPADRSPIPVPGTSLVLTRHSVKISKLDNDGDDDDDNDDVAWAALLQRWHAKGGGRLAYAKAIRLAVGGAPALEGGEIAYSDGTVRHLGRPEEESYGELQSRVLRKRRDVFALGQVAVQVGVPPHTQGRLIGCQMVLGDGAAWGDLPANGRFYPIRVLRPAADARVVGFCGRADRRSGHATEFGIVTAPRAVVDSADGLPRELYDMPEFMGLEDWSYESSDEEDGDEGDEEDGDEGDED